VAGGVAAGSRCGHGQEVGIGFAADVALEATQDLGLGQALGGAAGDVVLGGLVAVQADQGNAPQGAVGVAVAAAVQPVTAAGAAGGGRERRDAAEPGEGSFGAQPGGVVPGGDQQLPGGIDADAGQGDQLRNGGGDQRGELGVEVVDLGL